VQIRSMRTAFTREGFMRVGSIQAWFIVTGSLVVGCRKGGSIQAEFIDAAFKN